MTPSILVFAGSTRHGSFNVKLAQAASMTLARLGAEVTRISLEDYPLPILNEDLKSEKGIPENAMKLGRMISAHHGVFLACPEYNSSITPLLKNTIDWVSLISSDGGQPLKPWKGRVIALGSASDGRLGGIRGLYHVRSVMMNVGSHVITDQAAISSASRAFGEDGLVLPDMGAGLLEAACSTLIDHCAALNRYID